MELRSSVEVWSKALKSWVPITSLTEGPNDLLIEYSLPVKSGRDLLCRKRLLASSSMLRAIEVDHPDGSRTDDTDDDSEEDLEEADPETYFPPGITPEMQRQSYMARLALIAEENHKTGNYRICSFSENRPAYLSCLRRASRQESVQRHVRFGGLGVVPIEPRRRKSRRSSRRGE
eukprot:TRINITY_DN22244_c0_g1_i1.p1 TRINITY_DN22244_c0_g1~~TRINITY_DN22244_c0_g1_i1.p1  ORF type:complete len:201 (-),score=29.81 TRINITY_DN22244_c0_g1_i1:102-626(-)